MNLLDTFGKDSIERVENAIRAFQQGLGVVLADDENRENEGDLIYPAQTVNIENIAQLIRDCSGIICLCLTHEKVKQLKLPMMVSNNQSRFKTAFTVSIEATVGVSTGVSAKDRWCTIQTAIKSDATESDLVYPGHVFPLVARENGVLTRPGHTEGSIDLAKLSGLGEAAVLCELTNPDGSMSNLAQLAQYAKKHGLPLLTIEDIIYYRKSTNAHKQKNLYKEKSIC